MTDTAHTGSASIDWSLLSSMADSLSASSEPISQTLFDVLGVGSRELTISRVLAYYLDENESHGLERRFLDALIKLMKAKGSHVLDYPSPFEVQREVNFIDILIQHKPEDGGKSEWAIILENKVFHHLNNDLDKYWNSVPTEPKAGVVVSLIEVPIKKEDLERFVNVLHKDWLDAVAIATAEHWSGDKDGVTRQRLLFADFKKTMEKNTNALNDVPEFEEDILHFIKNWEKIDILLKRRADAQKYIQNHLQAAFSKFNFGNSVGGYGKDFYYPIVSEQEKPSVSGLRFYVENKLLTHNHLKVYFELYGEATEKGNRVSETVRETYTTLGGLRFDDNVTVKHSYYHLAYVEETNVLSSDGLSKRLASIIGRFFESKEDTKSLFYHCQQMLADE